MAWLAWSLYSFIIYFSLLEVLLSDNDPNGPKIYGELEMVNALKPLDSMCVDNLRTHSWWTYAVCFKRSALQVHVDSRTKTLSDRILLGEYVPDESSVLRQTYRTAEAKCAALLPNGATEQLPRTTVVNLRCCDVVVHLMRQSRHTMVTESKAKSAYWWPEQAVADASEELRGKFTQSAAVSAAGTSSSYKNSGSYRGSMSTATAEAYIHSVEENSACNYEVTVCSELVCAANGGHTGEYRGCQHFATRMFC